MTHPPLLVIEILSKDDTLRAMRERVDDYVVFGIQHIWLLDPGQRRARAYAVLTASKSRTNQS